MSEPSNHDHDDEEVYTEVIPVTVGPSNRVAYPLLIPTIIIGVIGLVVPLPGWVELLGWMVIIGLLGYTLWDIHRVRKFIREQ